ncbi:hypothetical protein [Limoniibacter endophyticus]|nr:hypothetical protein [Limoniibacter endophyticus]
MSEQAREFDKPLSPLRAAMREVRNAAAERDDVVVEMREAQFMRLEMLVAELEPVLADVPDDLDWFDFALSNGEKPRFWIDAVAHVSLGRDKRTLRFLKDTRAGRIVLAESADISAIAKVVTRYIADRMVERQRLIHGEPVGVKQGSLKKDSAQVSSTEFRRSRMSVTAAFGLVLCGLIIGLLMATGLFWDRVEPVLRYYLG